MNLLSIVLEPMTLEGMSDGMGGYIRRTRTDRGLSQKAVAESAGVSKGYLSTLEANKIGMPGADTRRRIAKALGVSHVDLLIAAGELRTDEVATGGVVEVDPNDPRELLAERVRRMRPDESDLALLNLMFDNWDARNKREGKKE
jgi:transcriptional regulator with XRE-family HTH domain